MKVTKRNGNIVDYDAAKICKAVERAFDEVEETHDDERFVNLISSIVGEVYAKDDSSDTPIGVEEIQDIVEDELMEYQYKAVAKAYIRYRYDHELKRQKRQDEEILNMIKGQDEYWAKENSNKNPTLVTVQRDYLAGITSTDIAKNYIFPKEVVDAHNAGICHQHDMDYMAQATLHNCDLINLEDMLQNGTVINNVRINKPHRLLTAMTITTQIMASVSASQYGGLSISLTHLAPFVRSSYNIFLDKYLQEGLSKELSHRLAKKDLEKEISDSVQTFNYQASTLFSLNGQAPFCSVFMYLNETEEYKKELILLIEEFCKQRIQGMPNRDGVPVTQAFPKLLYVLEEDNYKPGTKYWEVTVEALKCSACRLTPDYMSEKVMKEMKNGQCFPVMGCRSALSDYVDPETGKHKFYGRFNCGVSSLNLPDIAFSSYGDTDRFWKILEQRAEICHKGLQIRIERLSKTHANVAPILWMDGALARLKPEDTLYNLVHNGYATASLGYVGLYETTKIMTGQSQTEPQGKIFAIQVLQKLNDFCNKWKEEENVGYSLYATPAESLAYKFATKTRQRFPEEFQNLFGNKKYFENSYHIPSFQPIDPFEKIKFEGELQRYSSGGCLSYIESVDLSKNVEALYPIIEAIYNDTMYCEINIKTSYCQVCGQSQTIDVHKDKNGDTWWECSCCGNRDTNKMNVAARTCGYIGTNFWNDGKTQEIASRYISLDDHNCEERWDNE